MTMNIKREKRKHMLTMSNREHLQDSLYGVTFSGLLLNRPFQRMVKLLPSQLHKLYKSFSLYRRCEKFNMFGLKLIHSKSKSFDSNGKRWLQQSSSKENNSQADVHFMTECKNLALLCIALNIVLNTVQLIRYYNLNTPLLSLLLLPRKLWHGFSVIDQS